MVNWVLISVFGQDRPGIVASVSRVLYQNSCNIDDLSQTAIKGQFAMILIATSPQGNSLGSLEGDFVELARDLDLEIHLRKIKEEEMAPYAAGQIEPFIITARGEDQPGLVYGIAEVLAERGINITKMDGKRALVSQKMEYIQLFEADVPKTLDYGLVQEKLRERGREMGVEVDLQHRDIFRAINRI